MLQQVSHCASGVRAGSSFTWRMALLRCANFHSNHTKSDAVSFDTGVEQGQTGRGNTCAFEDHAENADHCRQQRHELQRGYGVGVALLCIVMFTFVILMI